MENEQSQVITERCISCGSCVKVCKQGAKMIEDGIGPVKALLNSGQKVAACIAPSFPAEFSDVPTKHLYSSLKRLGFTFIAEVSFGANLILPEYRRRIRDPNIRPLISSLCPAVTNLIELYYPNLIKNLAPIVSPMAALGRYIKSRIDPEMKCVFIGPCLAKKSEIKSPELKGEIDAVLTFDELRQLQKEENPTGDIGNSATGIDKSEPRIAGIELPNLSDADMIPISGGLSYCLGMSEGIIEGNLIIGEGKESCISILDDISGGRIFPLFVDLLFCRGCIDGPGMNANKGEYHKRRLVTAASRGKRDIFPIEMYLRQSKDVESLGGMLDLERGFVDRSLPVKPLDEDNIREILSRMGKSGEAELNCGACGYESCRDMAEAICKGIGELRMCLPNLIDELDQANRTVVRNNLDLQVLLELGRRANSSLNLDEIIFTLEKGMFDLFDNGRPGIFLYNIKAEKIIHSSCPETLHRLLVAFVENGGKRKVFDIFRKKRTADAFELAKLYSKTSGMELEEPVEISEGEMIFAPTVISEDIIGLISICRNGRKASYQPDASFTARDYSMLDLVADYFSNALKNAFEYREKCNLTERLEAMNELTKSVAESLDLENALRAITENLEKVLDADLYHLSVMDGERNYVFIGRKSITGNSKSDHAVPYQSNNRHIPFAGKAREYRAPFIIYHDESLDPGDKSFITQYGLKSVLVLPIGSTGDLTAIISFGYSTKIKSRVLAEEMERCSKAGEMLELLIRNARVFRDTNLELGQKSLELEMEKAKAQKAEKMAMLGRMAAIVAHELRTPVGSLRMSIYSLKRRIAGENIRCPEVATLEQSVIRLKESMDNLLEFSRETRLKKELCNINGLLHDICTPMKEAHSANGIKVEEDTEGTRIHLKIDKNLMERAMTNILLNAFEALAVKGDTITVSTSISGGRAVIRISDNGPGIPEEIRERIFEPFFSTKNKGTGLGLVVAKKIIDAHGGDVSVESGQSGTSFIVSLPL